MARRFAREGANLMLGDVDGPRLDTIARELDGGVAAATDQPSFTRHFEGRGA